LRSNIVGEKYLVSPFGEGFKVMAGRMVQLHQMAETLKSYGPPLTKITFCKALKFGFTKLKSEHQIKGQ
jgi:hypothetical protein